MRDHPNERDSGSIPLHLIDLLDRLRESLDRLPDRIAASLRRGPGLADSISSRVGKSVSKVGSSTSAASDSGDAGYAATIKPVVIRLARDFADRMHAGIGEVDSGLKKAAGRAAVAFARGVAGAGGVGGGRGGIPGLASPFGSSGNPIQLHRTSAGSWGAAGPPPIYARVLMPNGFGPGGGSGRGAGNRRRWGGKGWAGWKGSASSAWQNAAHKARRSYRAGKRAYNAGRGARAAASAAGAGLVGTGGALAFSQLGGAVTSIIKVSEALRSFTENVNDSNRHLAPFSGQLSAAFGRLDMGDQNRTLGMAKATENSAARLADRVNEMRNATQGMEKLGNTVKNQLAASAAAAVTPTLREISGIAESLSGWIERANPAGKIDTIHAAAAGSVGWAMGMIGSGFSVADANKAFQEAWKQVELDRKAGLAPEVSGWENFMDGAMNLPVLNPPRRFVP